MKKSLGLIGGGRISRVILEGLRRANVEFRKIVVSDISDKALKSLKEKFPYVETTSSNTEPANEDFVVLAVPPPAVKDVALEIKNYIEEETVVVSLAPAVTVSQMENLLGGFDNLVRMIPNACSIVNAGYNPVFFSPRLSEEKIKDFLIVFGPLGECPVVSEDKLEAYAVITAMGPTYFWFQFEHLFKLAGKFGIREEEAKRALKCMIEGAAKVMFEDELSFEEIDDLIPVKPLRNSEEGIKNVYLKLEEIYRKIKPSK